MDLQAVRKVAAYAFETPVWRRAVNVALVVGSILNLINQGDRLLNGAPLDWFKIILTFLVPYCVATYGAVSYRLDQERKKQGG